MRFHAAWRGDGIRLAVIAPPVLVLALSFQVVANAQDLKTYIEPLEKRPNVHLGIAIYNFDSGDPAIKFMLANIYNTGQQLITCEYVGFNPNGSKGKSSIGFWYEHPPAKIDDLIRIDKAGKFRLLGKRAISKCPDDEDEALAIRHKTMADMGFPEKN